MSGAALLRSVDTEESGIGGIGDTTLIHNPANGVDLVTGRPILAIFPSHFEPGWSTGRIGAWIRHYRPDLPLPTSPEGE